jgi:hypothetical protein
LFVVSGFGFDFRASIGSYAYFAVNEHRALRLTRKNREIESVLAEEWNDLPSADPVRLAKLVLPFYDGGMNASHQVLRDADELCGMTKYGAPPVDSGYRFHPRKLAAVLPRIGTTRTAVLAEGELSVRAVTLLGWMHLKRNLGIESFVIRSSGEIRFDKRIVLTKRIFARVPMIYY